MARLIGLISIVCAGFLTLVATGGGGGGGSAPAVGTVRVTVSGLPAGSLPAISLVGTGGTSRTVSGATTASDVPAGTYSVVVSPFATGGVTYAGTPTPSTVNVAAGSTVTVAVAYAPAAQSGSVQVDIAGLPAGTLAAVQLTGAGTFSRTVTASGLVTGVPAGPVTVSIGEVAVGTTRYDGTTATPTLTLASGARATVSVTYAVSLSVADPLYAAQWHLKNTGQAGRTGVAGTAGQDINVEGAWKSGILGTGVAVGVVEIEGVDIGHEDLQPNVLAGRSYDAGTGTSDPTSPAGDDGHGTAVAGALLARDNALGGRGVAPRAGLVGYRILGTDLGTIEALTRDASVAVFNNSWGIPPDGRLGGPSAAVQNAIDTALVTGRSGKGAVLVWSAGNGGDELVEGFTVRRADNSNGDGHKNHHGGIAVGAVDDRGVKTPYSEQGANVWVVAPSGSGRVSSGCDLHGFPLTDRMGSIGFNAGGSGAVDLANGNYTRCLPGTSFSAPLVAGTAALMLQANPNLGWRDVKEILARTARRNDPTDTGWARNAAGLNINHKYGFGVVDASAAVATARAWSLLGPRIVSTTFTATPNLAIPDANATGVSSSISVAGTGIRRIEWVEVVFSAADHPAWIDLEIVLRAPSGTTSVLAETQPNARFLTPGYDRWRFGSGRHLGEPADGTWTLTVRDRAAVDVGTFQSWSIRIYGRAE